MTVTFSALKPSLVFYPDSDDAGDVILADIGNPADLVENEESQSAPDRASRTCRSAAADSNKGTYGRVLDHRRIPRQNRRRRHGRTSSAARGRGTGYCCHCRKACLPMVAVSMPELMTEPLNETHEGTIANQSISQLDERQNRCRDRPGLDDVSGNRAHSFFVFGSECRAQMVIDADGLNALVGF